MINDIQTCPRCSTEKSVSEFAPSQRRAGGWCRGCYRTWYVEKTGGMVSRVCDGCGSRLTITARRAAESRVFCDRPCKDRFFARVKQNVIDSAKPDRNCRHCGAAMPKTMRSDAAYCSAACNSAAHQQTRKASARTGASELRIDRAYIIERDAGRCHLCKRKVPDGLVTLDHIVPLSKGGTHTPDNLAVACLPCNAAKRDRPMNEQLMLVG